MFCMHVDFYSSSFRHFNAGPMALPTDNKWQCHPYMGQCVKVDTGKVIPQYQIIPLVLIFRGDVLHTSMLGDVHGLVKVHVIRDAF